MAQDAGHIYLCSTEGHAVEPPPGGQMDYAGLACVSDPADPGGRRGSFGELAETVVCSSASSVLELDGARAAVDIAETQIDGATQIGSGWPKQVDFEFMPGADDDDEEEKEMRGRAPPAPRGPGQGCAVAYAVGESAVTLTGDAAGDTAPLPAGRRGPRAVPNKLVLRLNTADGARTPAKPEARRPLQQPSPAAERSPSFTKPDAA
ncbi:hypothetical protein JL721_7668 [Aureococcus anophagefferens]|nr:hypothetical protein JL721_7668 [Aureococcus anophagefferens]